MWEEILKGSSRVNYPIYRQKVYEGISNYIENSPLERVTIRDIERDRKKIIQYMRNEWSEVEDGRLAGFAQFLSHKFTGQIKPVINKLVRDGKLGELGRVSKVTTYEIIKAKDYGKVKPNKISSQMEEDIEEVVADNEFENNPTLSDKIKHILMQTPEGKQPKNKEDIKEFNRRFPGIKTNIVIEDDDDIEDMDSGCGCGCDGKEVTKAKVPAVRNAQYNAYVKFIKKVLKDEGGAAGMQNFIDAGNKIDGFKEKTLKYVISDAIDHDNWLAEHEFGDYYLYEGTE